MGERNIYLKFIIALLLFGSNGIVAGMISMASSDIVFYRTMIGAAVLILLFVTSMKKGNAASVPSSKKIPAGKKMLVVLSGTAMGVSWMFLYHAFTIIGVGMSTLIYYAAPMIVMILSPFFFRETITVKKAVCFAAVVFGMILINLEGASGSPDLAGTGFAFLSALSFAAMLILNKKAAVSGIENSCIQLTSAFAAVAAVMLLVTGAPAIPHSPSDIVWLIVLGTVNTGIGCYLYFSTFTLLPIQSASVLGYIEPVSALVLSCAILGESMGPLRIAGAVIVIISMMAMELRLPARQTAPHAARS